MSATIELSNVSVDRRAMIDGRGRALRVVSDVSLTVPTGGRLVMLGPSGAGKTSLLRLFNRLDDPVEGQVLLDGIDLRRLDPIVVRRRVVMVFQQPFLFDMTVEENLAYPLLLKKQELSRDKAIALLDELGLASEYLSRHAQQLSGGQQQRVAVARALIMRPEILLLDEPSSALDEESARRLLDVLLERNEQQGMSIIMVSHSPDIMRRLGGQALLVHEQRAQYFSDVDTALQEAGHHDVKVE